MEAAREACVPVRGYGKLQETIQLGMSDINLFADIVQTLNFQF